MKHLDEKLTRLILAIPTFTKKEKILSDMIVKFAIDNHFSVEKDEYGNVYMTKGHIDSNEYYPCLTAHLDTVHKEHIPYIDNNEMLTVKYELTDKGIKGYVDGIGIGGDDKCGVAIILSMLKYFEKLKLVFFVEEEGGSFGSKKMNIPWFNNVGYVIGYDSPELNRAAFSCKGNRLFSESFFDEHLKEICMNHGLTNFKSELNTDVRVIREKVSVQCMNFGSGYYLPHTSNEYVILEEMDKACSMGVDLIGHLGNNQYFYMKKTARVSYIIYDLIKYKNRIKKYSKKYISILTYFNINNLKENKIFRIFASNKNNIKIL